MAIADYSTLVAAIKTWCARSDSVFSAQIENFIGLAESRIYDGYGEKGEPAYSPPLRTKALETTGTITLTDGSGTVPTDFLQARKLYRSGDQSGITFIPPERFDTVDAATGSGLPVYYTVEGSTISVVPSSGAETISLLYYRRLDPLSSGNPSNALLLSHDMIVLSAALYEAFSFMQAAEQALGHAARCRSMIQGANKTAAALRYAGPLRVRHRQPIP